MKTRKDKYKYDPEYRAKALARSKANHDKWVKFPIFRKLRTCRTTLHRIKESAENCRLKLWNYKRRIERLERKKEELELEFGMLRANVKRKEREQNARIRTEPREGTVTNDTQCLPEMRNDQRSS